MLPTVSLDDCLSVLENVKEVGKDRWIASCPVHLDKTPSLSVARGSRVALMLHCFSCDASFRDIINAISARRYGVTR
jgi:DNA primase